MARPHVVDKSEGTRFPFLRGILTRSLHDAGVPFEKAYALATKLRSELSEAGEITTEDLRARVVKHLEPYGSDVVQRYLGPAVPASVQIRYSDGHESPFSRGRHRSSLASCGLAPEDAAATAARIYDDLVANHAPRISSRDLRHLTYRHLHKELGETAARQYLVYQEFRRTRRPLLVVIGGAVGSGKSTIAAQVAHRLEIVRFQSTDMLREVMRMMIPQRLMPVLHTSTFKAWTEMPAADPAREADERSVVDGYLAQANLLSVACEAVVRRAVRERVSLILEGVHAHPGLMQGIEQETDAIVVRVMLAVLKKRQLESRIRGRGKEEPDRRAKRYLKHFESIWDLQSFMLSEADQLGVPIVPNDDFDSTVLQVMNIIMAELASRFRGTPDEVF